MAEHTPTPWVAVPMESGGFKIVPANDPNFKICRIENAITYLMAFDEAAKPDAELIVEAVNAYEPMKAELESLREEQRERLWCQACGTVTRDRICDCNRYPEGHEMRREPNFVNYADQLQKDGREAAQEAQRLRNLVEEVMAQRDALNGDVHSLGQQVEDLKAADRDHLAAKRGMEKRLTAEINALRTSVERQKRAIERVLTVIEVEWKFPGAHPHREAVLRDLKDSIALPSTELQP